MVKGRWIPSSRVFGSLSLHPTDQTYPSSFRETTPDLTESLKVTEVTLSTDPEPSQINPLTKTRYVLGETPPHPPGFVMAKGRIHRGLPPSQVGRNPFPTDTFTPGETGEVTEGRVQLPS